MAENWNLAKGDTLDAWFLDRIQDFIGSLTADLTLSLADPRTAQIAPGLSGAAAVGVDGLWRYRTTPVTAALAGAAGTYDVYVVASAPNISGGVDSTDYTFGLVLVAHGAAAPAGTYNGNAIAQTRKIGEIDWDGSTTATGLRQLSGPNSTAPVTPTAPTPALTPARVVGAAGQIAALQTWQVGSAAVASVGADGTLNAAGYDVAGVPLASGNLSDSAALARLASPAFTGTPTAPTPALDDSTTRIATTAWFFGQQASAAPPMDGTATVGSSTRWARADHVHPTDSSRAPLASPAFTGTPTAPTPAVSDNSTRIATTAYVLGQASAASPAMNGAAAAGTANTWARGDHVHPTDTTRAPLASPTLTGTVTLPSIVSQAGQVGFYGVGPVARPAARTMSNLGPASRTIDRNNYDLQNLFDFVMTVVADFQANGLL